MCARLPVRGAVGSVIKRVWWDWARVVVEEIGSTHRRRSTTRALQDRQRSGVDDDGVARFERFPLAVEGDDAAPLTTATI
jgi:hypothetical protein